jgi:predicted lipoprotein with Yx(FWY)xxD motif
MKARLPLIVTIAALSIVTLAGCSGTSSGGGGYGSAPTTSSAPAPASGNDLATGTSSLGTIVVDGHGMTVYFYLKDVKGSGTSNCTGGCLALWPAVTASSSTPTVAGVTGTVGSIKRNDGTMQVTIDGMPVYTYAQDSKAGDVTGEGVGNIWYVVKPDGTAIKSGSGTKSTY